MSDGSFREIQLTAKQVVFLFMAGLVAAVGIFLLGVQVGQRVSPDAPPAEATGAADAGEAVPATMPPPTTPRPGELTAPNELQNRPVPTVTATPTPTPDPPAVSAPVTTPTPTPTSKPAPSSGPEKTATAKPAPTGTHFVQTDQFASRANADRQAARLKSRGYPAEVFVGPSSDRVRYKVRIGPLPERDARDLQARLRKEGLRPSLVPR